MVFFLCWRPATSPSDTRGTWWMLFMIVSWKVLLTDAWKGGRWQGPGREKATRAGRTSPKTVAPEAIVSLTNIITEEKEARIESLGDLSEKGGLATILTDHGERLERCEKKLDELLAIEKKNLVMNAKMLAAIRGKDK
eukprot:TRINITY_DN9769_c0_g1_i2.p2 TRINITY_DN9769_c0_g1~~TRINITY_DN9769_c0_g1_i2.p2  ORF type:complete len:138 (+),score=15.38 TRINITY_DN9769_c0_g1_i2:164-577(+)